MGEFIWIVKELMIYSVPTMLLVGLLPLLDLLSYKREKGFVVAGLILEIVILPAALYFHSEIFTIISLLIGFSAGLYAEKKIAENIKYEESHIFLGTILFGIILSIVTLILRGFDLESIVYSLTVIGVASAMALSKHYSFISEVILALTLVPLAVVPNYSTLVYPILMLISMAISLNGLGMNIKIFLSEKVELKWDKFNNYFSMVFAVVMLFAFVGVNIIFFDRLFLLFQSRMSNALNFYSNIIYRCYQSHGTEFLEKGLENQIPTRTIEKVYIIKNGKAVYPFSAKDEKWESYKKEKNLKISTFSKVFPDGTKIILVYESPKSKSLFLLLIYIVITGVAITISMFIMNHIYYKKWTDILETEIMRKTQEISAANEELSAMNEELLSMNEEIESMYKNLSKLNTSMLEFLNFLKNIDIKEDVTKIFDNLYTTLNEVLSIPLMGYEVVDEEGNIKISKLLQHVMYSTDVKISRYIIRIFSKEPFQIGSDEEKFIEMLSLIAELIITSHENYYTLEKSKNFLAALLDLVNVISTTPSLEEVEETLLRKGVELFDDVVIVALAWKKCDEKVVNVKFIKSKDNKIIEKKLTTGIIKYSINVGEEYITGDVSADPVFYVESPKTKSAVALPLITDEGIIGVFEIERSTRNAFTNDDLKFLRIFTSVVAITLQRLRYAGELKETLMGLAEALSYAIELKDPYTHGHSRRVADYSVEIAKEMGLSEKKIEEIELAAILHDIGKIGIKGMILNKPGKLTKVEFEEIKKHPVIGAELVGKVKALRHVAKIIRHHHERCDGKGYPDGLTCEKIPIESRIIAVADAFDAMTSDRPYRKALSVRKAIQILEGGKEKQWDERVVDAALRVFRRMFKIDA